MSNEHFPQPSFHVNDSAVPPAVDRASFEAELDALRVREKAHTHEGDAIAAARRRLPMVEVDATTRLMGPNGHVTLLEVFEGRRQLIAWNAGINRPGEGDESALHRRSSESRWPRVMRRCP
jgi:predicted dithiol-disulfide oxidoreductase (DUF899 family)